MRLTGFENLDRVALPSNRPFLYSALQILNSLLSDAMPIDQTVYFQARDPQTGSFLIAKLTESTDFTDEAFLLHLA